MLRKLLVFVLFLTGIAVLGQNIDHLYKDAQSKFFAEDLINARGVFKEIVELEPSFKDSKYRLEICELLTNYRNRPIDSFLAYASTSGRTDKFYNYWLGLVYVDKYEFREAIAVWRRFLSSKAYKSPEIREEVNRYIKEAESLILVFDNPDDYEIHRLPINTEFDEITPVFFEDKNELLFASSRDGEKRNRPSYKMYHTIQTGERKGGTWTPPVVMEDLGTFTEGNANLELVHQDHKLFQFRPEKGGDLYYSDPSENGWTDLKEFDNSITKAHIKAHFFINEHEDRVIFASSEHYKKEGLELYQSYLDATSGKWSKPARFSPNISTGSDEDTPYLSLDEKSIYFSSDRPGGLGGYDIYVSRLNEETRHWGQPINLGFPINSPDNEKHFKMNPDQTSGYFSSDRYRSQGEYDVYFYWEIEKVNMTGRIVDLATKKPVANAVITFRPLPYEDEYFRSETDSAGNYVTRIIASETFSVVIEKEGKVLYTDKYDVQPTEDITTTYHQDFFIGVGVDPIVAEYEGLAETETEIGELGSKFRPGRTAIIRNIYFDHGTSQLKGTSEPILEELLATMRKSPDLKIEVAGHTDSTGPADVNNKLSLSRARSIQKWLAEKGVGTSRIVLKGYGESKPLASNDDEKDGRELNRRIEIRVIE